MVQADGGRVCVQESASGSGVWLARNEQAIVFGGM